MVPIKLAFTSTFSCDLAFAAYFHLRLFVFIKKEHKKISNEYIYIWVLKIYHLIMQAFIKKAKTKDLLMASSGGKSKFPEFRW